MKTLIWIVLLSAALGFIVFFALTIFVDFYQINEKIKVENWELKQDNYELQQLINALNMKPIVI